MGKKKKEEFLGMDKKEWGWALILSSGTGIVVLTIIKMLSGEFMNALCIAPIGVVAVGLGAALVLEKPGKAKSGAKK